MNINDEQELNLKADAMVINKALLDALANFEQLGEASIIYAIDFFIISNWFTAARGMSREGREEFFDLRLRAVKYYLDDYDNLMSSAMSMGSKKLGGVN